MRVAHIFMWIGILLAILVLSVLLLWLIRWWAQGKQFRKKHIRLTGKIVIITGCNTGVGKETAIDLAKRGAKVYMACRDQKRGDEARLQIIKASGNSNVFFMHCDLASFASIRAFVKEFLRVESNLHILINNAGVMFMPRTESKDGFEMHLATNHLGHFLLTNLLLDTLKASMPSRIINVSSDAYKFGRINRNDLNSEKTYSEYQAYFQSKLANILFTRSLCKRLLATGVTVNAVHPGVVNSELQRHMGITKFVLMPFLLCMKNVKSGAQTTLCVAIDPELEQVSGQYFNDCQITPTAEHARDEETAEWLWEVSEELTGLNDIDENV